MSWSNVVLFILAGFGAVGVFISQLKGILLMVRETLDAWFSISDALTARREMQRKLRAEGGARGAQPDQGGGAVHGQGSG